jgi:putative holliday junction resolvase
VRILGIDPGEARVGLALSDPNGRIAVPSGVFQRKGRNDAIELAAVAHREEAELIVVGLPLSLDGSTGPQARRARKFGNALRMASGLPVIFWDERFSSRQATQFMVESGTSRRRRKSDRDATAAAIILQDFLDSHPDPDRSIST